MNESTDRLVEAVRASGVTIAVAESLTSGKLASALGAASDASEWFRGGVVAYASEVKFDVLGVTRGPVVSESCAHEMAEGVRHLLGADIGVAVTGVGGPGPDDGVAAGTVFGAIQTPDSLIVREWHFDGGPSAVLDATISATLDLLTRAAEGFATGAVR